MRFVSGLGLVGALVIAFAGCRRPSLDEVIHEHQAGLEAKLAAIKQLEPTLAVAGREASDSFQVPADPLILEPDSKANAAVVHVEDLRDPAEQAAVALRTNRAKQFFECGSILRKKKYVSGTEPIPKVAASLFEECEAVRYLLIVRTFEHEAPHSVDDDNSTPGRFDGDVLVYEIANKKSFGGFKISVKNSASISVVGDQPDRLSGDLEANLSVAIDDAIRARIPGALPPKR